MKLFFLSFLITSSSWAATYSLDCKPATEQTSAMNTFNVTGSVEVSEKGLAEAQLVGSTRLAGIQSNSNEITSLNLRGTSRVYPAKTLGYNEVTLLQIKGDWNGRQVQLTAASGLLGPQSTLTIQGIPFRAECKLK